ncbi:hypothetical protein THRCLA_20631 [Thraustotheca clavata]|uniref:Uncharacterized protein n=1 Tax=Thraustotheca clavata TaxID=74557 RepID=A0A1W0A551_9STRA|nr:hypothetical protein THRCLA_20631 [Thraustotheca clavata]
MKSNPSQTFSESFDERMCNVFTLDEAIPELNEYLSSICIDDDNPGFDLDKFNAFVAAVNVLDPALVPPWMRTRPLQITVKSFTDDLVYQLHLVAGGRCGRDLLAPNNSSQFAAVVWMLSAPQNRNFMQGVAKVALPIVDNAESILATTYRSTETNSQRSEVINLVQTASLYIACSFDAVKLLRTEA